MISSLPAAAQRLVIARIFSMFGAQVQGTAVAWHVYLMTGRKLDLGLVGLAQFVPMFLLAPIGGQLSDTRDRRSILVIGTATFFVTSIGFVTLALQGTHDVRAVYLLLVAFASIRSIVGPAQQALMPSLVGPDALPRALALSTLGAQLGMLAGPALGGLLCATTYGPLAAYAFSTVLFLITTILLTGIPKQPRASTVATRFVESALEGLRFLRTQPVLMGAIALDLAAVLLGGVVALLPIFAKDILHASGIGFGIMRASPAIGAAIVGVWLARNPIRRKLGPTFFISVGVFGIATLGFALSSHLIVAIVCLAIAGGADMVSMVIRGVLVPALTPPEMRGRVSAVNMVFIGASNELGEFESGVTAEWLGTRPAAVLGACGTLLSAVVFAWLFPSLRKLDQARGHE